MPRKRKERRKSAWLTASSRELATIRRHSLGIPAALLPLKNPSTRRRRKKSRRLKQLNSKNKAQERREKEERIRGYEDNNKVYVVKPDFGAMSMDFKYPLPLHAAPSAL